MDYLLLILSAYLLGSIPFGLVMGWLTQKQDIRRLGTKNAGASNTFLVVGPLAATLTALLDILKGFLSVTFAWWWFQNEAVVSLAGIAVVAGHIWPIFFGFRGGKGIATAAGVFLFLAWPLVILALVSWVLIMLIWPYVALTNALVFALMPIYALVFGLPSDYVLFALVNAMLLAYSHRENISRYLQHQEPTLREWLKNKSQKSA